MFEEMFHRVPGLTVVGPDILLCKFLTPSGCEYLRACIDNTGNWTPDARDEEYFTQDIHLEKHLPDMYEMLREHLHNTIFPQAAKHWHTDSFEVSNLFAIKYSLDTQKSLAVHHDTSFITGSVKINYDYEGAELFFPEKNFNNSEISIGDILIWPGQITHRHGCTELLSGEKHALTIWTEECTK
tara:strand:+ start:49 stop:600 length:552 start_codon:yes stop_codon:yes gene_type:complete